ncbi:putative mannosyl-oligosaccharide glucosidase [Aphelenchoides besseyi]|nr:putative mannosyl-oligosaccharide glucosidase [Aphelenchoides besseyi]
MTKKHDKRPPNAVEHRRLGDRPAFLSSRSHRVIQFVAVIVGIAFVRYLQYRNVTTIPNVKSDLPLAKFSEFNPHSWGSYRPQSYFGLKTRRPGSPIFGMAWYNHQGRQLTSDLRHWCNQDEGVYFLWEMADGKSMGKQRIYDQRLNITTDWFNRDQSWSSQVKVARNDSTSTGLVFYFATQDTNVTLRPMFENDELHRLWIHSPDLSDFSLEFDISAKKGFKRTEISVRAEPFVDPTKISDLIRRGLYLDEKEDGTYFTGLNQKVYGETFNPNFFAVHFDIPGDAEILIEYRDETEPPLPNFEDEMAKRVGEFEQKLRDTFIGDNKNVKEHEFQIGKFALSNMLGGIGYWDGPVRMKSKHWPSERIETYGPLELLSAVPSRPFFPRGFIWDEGFHNLLIREFDPELSLDIVASWLNTMNVEGWIPREMILGIEAEAKVPAEFLVQSDRVANPPVFFYLMDKFVHNPTFIATHKSRILSMYPRLKKWYLWLRDSQQGPLRGTFQWQGRNSTTPFELNPKTLPSGLDDFPRSTHPTITEYHVDLRSWLAVASRVIRYLAELSSDNSFINEADQDQRLLNDFDELNRLHWSEKVERYCDFGLHSTDVRLETKVEPNREPKVIRRVLKEPREGLVENTNGYVGLFPFILKLVLADSTQLTNILKQLDNPEELWSPYGLRSISKSSTYYNKRNTKDDPPYWRGDIWLNINYMTLEALRHYSRTASGPNGERSAELYAKLRSNLINMVVNEFDRTGYFWEHYCDRTGRGAGTRPFTGWTSLIFAIITEKYD